MIERENRSSKEFEVKTKDGGEQHRKGFGLRCRVAELLDFELLKDPIYVNIVLGITFAVFADMFFTNLMPVYLVEKGITMV